FTDLINVLKRVKNILKDVKTTEINSDLIREEEEKALLEVLLTLKDKDFSSTIDILLENKDVINNFFNNIKINVEDVEMKNNRLALLNNILKTTGNIIEI
ncbi:glycine--tRNA ligase subunit beta, partial [Sneathia sp. DSM 16630]|nr:glycine--tRNA ligase subunit beta [Sneathia sp. DSM 16630]